MHRVEITKVRDDGGIMAAIMLPDAVAQQIALPGYEPAGKLHLTLAYCGLASDASQESLDYARDLLGSVATFHGPLRARLTGYGKFEALTSDQLDVVYAAIACPGIDFLRQLVVKCLEAAGLVVDASFDFTPHVTLAYLKPSSEVIQPPLPTDVIELNELSFVADTLTSHFAFLGENIGIAPPAPPEPEPIPEPVPEPPPPPPVPPTLAEIVEGVMQKILATGILTPPKRGKIRRILVKNPKDGTLAEVIEEPID